MKRLIPLLLLLLVFPCHAAFTLVDYYGNYTMTTGKDTINYNMYFKDGNKMRIETKTPQGQAVSIIRVDKKVCWLLLVEQKTYMEKAFNKKMADAYQPGEEYFSKAKKVGEETVLGYPCDIYECIEGKTTSQSWIATGKGILIKAKIKDGNRLTIVEARSIKEGKQAANLFEIPGEYEKFSLDLPNLQ